MNGNETNWRDALKLIDQKLSEWEERGRPLKVLLVDDDPNDVELISRKLANYECELTVCQDSTQAAELIRHGTFDLVFMDLQMPQMSGKEVLELVMPPVTSSTRFVLVTGFPSSPLVDATLKLGAVMAPKPLTDQILRSFLRPKK